MTKQTLTLNNQERDELLLLLRHALGEARVEVHHTHTPNYRENVKTEEGVIRRLLEKVQGLSV
jgi:hypothetical protein